MRTRATGLIRPLVKRAAARVKLPVANGGREAATTL